MSCERFREAITGHAAGAELDPAAAAHLAACDACAARLDRQRRLLAEVDAELERALAMTASSEFVAGVTARVRTSDGRPAAVWIGLAAAAAIAAAAFLRAPVTPVPAAPSASSAAGAPSAPLATTRPIVEPVVPSVAHRPVAVRRSAAKVPRPVAARHV